MSDRNEEILNEVQAQAKLNAQKNEEYFARMNAFLRKNQELIRDMQELKRRNHALWQKLGIDLDDREGKENPFLFLEKVAPEAFSGLSEWVGKSRKAAQMEADRVLSIMQSDRQFKKEEKSPFFSHKQVTADENHAKSMVKRSVRRVRI